jgi:hypothetical protein
VIPRSRGGPTALHNLVPLCQFHHLGERRDGAAGWPAR